MIRFLLTYRIDLTDAHPNLMLAALCGLIAIGCCLPGVLERLL